VSHPPTVRLPRPHFVPSPGFRNLSTVCSATLLSGLFHPEATSRVLGVQGLLPPHSHPPSSGGASPLSLSCRPLARHPCRRPVATAAALDFEAFFRARTRAVSSGVSRAGGRFPLPVPLPQVSVRRRGPCLPGPSALGVTILPVLAYRFVAASSVLSTTHLEVPSPGPPTCPSFRPASPKLPRLPFGSRFHLDQQGHLRF